VDCLSRSFVSVLFLRLSYLRNLYSTLLRFWPVEDLTELADGPTGGGEVARGGCLFGWNFSVAVLPEAERCH
jgi:hypothetical protein